MLEKFHFEVEIFTSKNLIILLILKEFKYNWAEKKITSKNSYNAEMNYAWSHLTVVAYWVTITYVYKINNSLFIVGHFWWPHCGKINLKCDLNYPCSRYFPPQTSDSFIAYTAQATIAFTFITIKIKLHHLLGRMGIWNEIIFTFAGVFLLLLYSFLNCMCRFIEFLCWWKRNTL